MLPDKMCLERLLSESRLAPSGTTLCSASFREENPCVKVMDRDCCQIRNWFGQWHCHLISVQPPKICKKMDATSADG